MQTSHSLCNTAKQTGPAGDGATPRTSALRPAAEVAWDAGPSISHNGERRNLQGRGSEVTWETWYPGRMVALPSTRVTC